jgi:hypothetical protein
VDGGHPPGGGQTKRPRNPGCGFRGLKVSRLVVLDRPTSRWNSARGRRRRNDTLRLWGSELSRDTDAVGTIDLLDPDIGGVGTRLLAQATKCVALDSVPLDTQEAHHGRVGERDVGDARARGRHHRRLSHVLLHVGHPFRGLDSGWPGGPGPQLWTPRHGRAFPRQAKSSRVNISRLSVGHGAGQPNNRPSVEVFRLFFAAPVDGGEMSMSTTTITPRPRPWQLRYRPWLRRPAPGPPGRIALAFAARYRRCRSSRHPTRAGVRPRPSTSRR